MKTKTVERLMNETPEHIKQQVSTYADRIAKKKYYKPKKKREIIEVDIKDLDLNHDYIQNGSIKLPKRIGKYCIGSGDGFCIHFIKKPNWLHRTMMKVCLGWKWENDIK